MKVREYPLTLTRSMLEELFEGFSTTQVLEIVTEYPNTFRDILRGGHISYNTPSDLKGSFILKVIPPATINKLFGIESPYKKGELLAVRDGSMWVLRYFSHINPDGSVDCFDYQDKTGATSKWSLHMSAGSLVLPE